MIVSYRPTCQTATRIEVDATVQINYPFETKILLEDGRVLDTAEWEIRGCKVVQADKTERQSLVRMGLLKERKGKAYVQ